MVTSWMNQLALPVARHFSAELFSCSLFNMFMANEIWFASCLRYFLPRDTLHANVVYATAILSVRLSVCHTHGLCIFYPTLTLYGYRIKLHGVREIVSLRIKKYKYINYCKLKAIQAILYAGLD